MHSTATSAGAPGGVCRWHLAALLLLVLSFFIASPPVVPCCPFGSGAWVKAITTRVFFGTLVAWLLFTAMRLHGIASKAAVRPE